MDKRRLGNTDLLVSRLGVGLAEIGELELADADRVARLLNTALDSGVNYLDTAACYGNSEELVGRTVAARRAEFVISTKAGHVVGDYPGEPWTAKTIADSIDRSLARLKTDYVDVVQLHSCDLATLQRGEVIEALLAAKRAGKTRYIGYSGDNEAAEWAVASGRFDTLQTSYNLVDQQARTRLFPAARAKGMGIIVKRPIANGVWAAAEVPGAYEAEYFRRARAMQDGWSLPDAAADPIALALGFTLAHDAADTAIVGTANPDHMAANLAIVQGPLPVSPRTVQALQHRFDALAADWQQMG